MRYQLLTAWLLVTLASAGDLSSAEDVTPTAADIRQGLVSELAELATQRLTIQVGGTEAPLVLHPESLLSWSNPTVGEVYGEVFVWTHRGRPACMASVYRWFSPDWGATLELSSLTSEPLIARDQEQLFWKPSPSPMVWKALPDTDPPAATASARLVQLRRIARRFSARLHDTRSAAKAVPRQLRIMAQPIFRYPVPRQASNYADGALFAFVEGTDPELLLLVECSRQNEEGRWRAAFARMNSNQLEVSEGARTVWQCDHLEFDDILNSPADAYALHVVNGVTGQVSR